MKRWAPGVLAIWLAVALDAGLAEAQAPPRSPSFDWGVGVLLSLPDELESERCGSLFAGEGRLGARVPVSRVVALESSLAFAVPRSTTCAAGDAAVPIDGTVVRRRPRDGVDRNVIVSSRHRVVLDARPGRRWGPQVLLGGGRLWTQRAWFWSAGVGVRLASGSALPTLEVEGMRLALPSVEEITVYSEGMIVARSSGPGAKIRDSVWSVRVRLPLG